MEEESDSLSLDDQSFVSDYRMRRNVYNTCVEKLAAIDREIISHLHRIHALQTETRALKMDLVDMRITPHDRERYRNAITREFWMRMDKMYSGHGLAALVAWLHELETTKPTGVGISFTVTSVPELVNFLNELVGVNIMSISTHGATVAFHVSADKCTLQTASGDTVGRFVYMFHGLDIIDIHCN